MPTINVNQTNASETAKGIVEEATQAEVNAGTDTGGTGARLFVIPSKLLSLLGSYLTTASAAATYQTIAGLFTSVMGLVLTGFAAGANTAVAATDTLAQALAKFQGQINARATLSSPTFTGTPAAPTAASGTNSTQIATTAFVQDAVAKQPEVICIACSDETTDLTTGTAKVTFRMPFAMTLYAGILGVKACLSTAATGATLLQVDINESGTSILSTKLTFDASETTTTTAATAVVISDTSLADDAVITIDIDAVGNTTAGKGLKVYLMGTRT